MKLLFSTDWLRKKIAADPDNDPDAGRSYIRARQMDEDRADAEVAESTATADGRVVKELRIALGKLVHQLRSKKQISIKQLAEAADVDEEQLRRVEHDPHFTASPRLIFQLSAYFDVPLGNLSQLAGVTQRVNRTVYNDAVRYAARSEDVSILSAEELEALDLYVGSLHSISKAGV